MTFVLGIMLFRNEEIFLERAASNIAGFCDQVVLIDNGSTDESPAIAQRLVARFPHFSVTAVTTPSITHRMISHLAGTPTWVFGVDADEIYDPQGLEILRSRLDSGELDRFFEVKGHSFHCRGITFGHSPVALGHMSPESRPVTKLYNFGALYRWDNHAERLHGRARIFRPRYGGKSVLRLADQEGFLDGAFRCLHVCFLPRSRTEINAPTENPRLNPWEKKRKPDSAKPADYKRSYYMNGPAQEIDTAPFFPPLQEESDREAPLALRQLRLPAPGTKGPEAKSFWRDAQAHFRIIDYAIRLLSAEWIPGRRLLMAIEVEAPDQAIDIVWRGHELIQALVTSVPPVADGRSLVTILQLPVDRILPGRPYRFELALEPFELVPDSAACEIRLASPVVPQIGGDVLYVDLPPMPDAPLPPPEPDTAEGE